jgi:hypothetical protein
VFALTSFMRAGFNTQMSFFDMATPQLIQGIAMAAFSIPLSGIILSGLGTAQMTLDALQRQGIDREQALGLINRLVARRPRLCR